MVLPHKKLGNEQIIKIPEEFFGDYLRGYFDGDGSIGSYKNNVINFQITSKTNTILLFFKNKLNIGNVRPRKTCFDWVVRSRKDISKLYQLMYKTNDICLERKRKIFEKIING